MQCKDALPCPAMPCYAMPCHAMLWVLADIGNCAGWYYIILYDIVMYRIIWYKWYAGVPRHDAKAGDRHRAGRGYSV